MCWACHPPLFIALAHGFAASLELVGIVTGIFDTGIVLIEAKFGLGGLDRSCDITQRGLVQNDLQPSRPWPCPSRPWPCLL